MEFFKKRAARKAAKEQVKEAIRQADERVAKKRAEKIDEALEQAVEKQDAEKEALEKLSADHVSQDETIIALREALADDADKRIHITAQTAVAAVFSVLKDEKGIRIEDALAVIGAFAGHMAIRAAMNAGASGDEERLTVIAAANDESAFYGPAITDFLIRNEYARPQSTLAAAYTYNRDGGLWNSDYSGRQPIASNAAQFSRPALAAARTSYHGF